MTETEFFMVWNPQGHQPTYRHLTLSAATTEARRLAQKCPGQEFFILRAIGRAKMREPVEVIRLESIGEPDPYDDGIPF